VGSKEGMQALIKRSEPEATWTMIHHESRPMKELSPKMSEMMDTVVRTVNYVKTRPLRSRFFAELWDEMGAQGRLLLFHCNSR
jgi:hypothetical protein